jgi:hypothetical protein
MCPVTGKDSFYAEHGWAEKIGAATTGKNREFTTPFEGDIVWTAGHMNIIERWENPASVDAPYIDVWTIDGGQTCKQRWESGHDEKGLQAIERRKRRWWFGKVPRIQAIDTVITEPKNEVLGWIVCDRLPHE